MTDHDQNLARAFDSQAPKFEVAPVQSDPLAIAGLVRAADLPRDSLVLDAGCGPGLVSSGLLEAGHRVVGVDLSAEMIDRARRRCAAAGARATFLQVSVFDPSLDQLGPFDAALSRYVLHHVESPEAFIARQAGLLRSGGILVVSDHITDPDPAVAAGHNAIEIGRDQTHTRNLAGGELVDLLTRAGLHRVSYVEEPFTLDFDEWFDRGTPCDSKAAVRSKLLSGPVIRTFRPHLQADGSIRIEGMRAIVRGQKQSSPARKRALPAASLWPIKSSERSHQGGR
jgi:2-polyprenyl-3-methyl-5-hydroxy-6-metoxy-1,4-benzoquinol methylase